MEIECAYTMANAVVRLQFLAMERSLRATGFDRPLKVFPYDNRTFDLPAGSEWLRTPLHEWLDGKKAHPMCSKYHCLTQSSYFFTDTDIVYLRNPSEVLAPLEGFVVADTEWSKPRYTFTEYSARILAQRTSVWLSHIFSAGQFACDRALYPEEKLRELIDSPDMASTCLYDTDQTGLNLLVPLVDVTPLNLNLPPHSMESTWAGDYPGEFRHLWLDPQRKPYFMHWAGPVLDDERPVNDLFYEFLTATELREWREQQRVRLEKARRAGRWPLGVRALNAAVRILYPRYRVQPANQ